MNYTFAKFPSLPSKSDMKVDVDDPIKLEKLWQVSYPYNKLGVGGSSYLLTRTLLYIPTYI